MLVLTRNVYGKILIGDNIEVVVVDINRDRRQVRLGITAPKEIRIMREELGQYKEENRYV